MAERLTAHEVRRALYLHFAERYAVVFEVTARPEGTFSEALAALPAGATPGEVAAFRDTRRNRRVDALLVRRAPKRAPSATQLAAQWRAEQEARRAAATEPEPAGLFPTPAAPPRPAAPDPGDDGGLDRLALEIKVSRGDFLADVKDPTKQAPWRELAHRHAYVVPEGLVQLGEVPAGSGLLVVRRCGEQLACEWARKAPRAATARPLPLEITLDAFYRWSRAEALTKGLTGENRKLGGEDELRAEVDRLRHQVELLEGKVVRAQDTTAAWKRRYAALDPPPCSTCAKPLRPARRGIGDADGFLRWEHAKADEEACQAERHRQALAAHLRKPEDKRWGFYVPGPEPRYPGDPEQVAEHAA